MREGLIGENHACEQCEAQGFDPVFRPNVLPAASDLLESFIAEANRHAEESFNLNQIEAS
jgi:hypothetical protein